MFPNRNKERLEELAAIIENEPYDNRHEAYSGFGMNYLHHSCGTPSCIAGYAAWLSLGKPETLSTNGWNLEQAAARWLGIMPQLDDRELESIHAYPLFYPDIEQIEPENGDTFWDISPKQAARTLRHFAATGLIDWNV